MQEERGPTLDAMQVALGSPAVVLYIEIWHFDYITSLDSRYKWPRNVNGEAQLRENFDVN